MTEGMWIHPKAAQLATAPKGAMVELKDGSLMVVDGASARFSKDDGQTWTEKAVFAPGGPKARWEYALLRTAKGALVLVYMDEATIRPFNWDNEKHTPDPESRVEVWTTRSLDEGRTWARPQPLYTQGWTGAILNIIQTRSGRLVVPVQRMLPDPARHAQVTYFSDDEGQTWTPSNVIDLGGHGHHDGCCEGAVTELRDGRLWMLIRTNLDRFWQAFSDDGGASWRVLKPSDIDASSSPGHLLRLRSGRLLLAWNRLYPEGLSPDEQARYERRGGDRNLCERPASWQRNELSVALSDDDGVSWRTPRVIIRARGVSYPFAIERLPGLVWVYTRFPGQVGVSLKEQDLL